MIPRIVFLGLLLLASAWSSSGLAQPPTPRTSRREYSFFRQTLPAADASSCIGLQLSPLIGGPTWLPVHVKVVLETDAGDYKWDFVPLKPSDPATLQKLLSLQAVPAEIRSYSQATASEDSGDDDVVPLLNASHLVQRAQTFCDEYPDRDLSLISNNCWVFAYRLYQSISATS